MRLRGAFGLVAGLVCGLVSTQVCPAGADPEPVNDVAQAHKAVRERAHRLGEAQTRLSDARARLEDLEADAELLVEEYNGELVRLGAARAAYEQSAGRVRQAEQQVAAAREPIVAMVAGTYSELDYSDPFVAMFAGSDGLEGYLHRASMLSQLGGEQAATLQRLGDAEEVYTILRGQSERAYATQREMTGRVEAAKSAAENAVAGQVQQTARIRREKEDVAKRLDAARSKVERLLAARAAARAAALERSTVWRSGLSAPSWAVEWAKRSSAGMGGVAAQWALTQLGKPYVWAAAGPSSYDCSGLTMRAWEQAGVALDHWTGTQWTAGPHVPVNELRSGDLVFFAQKTSSAPNIHHVGIYIGRGLMVHAPQTGDVVRIASIWRNDLMGATRPGQVSDLGAGPA